MKTISHSTQINQQQLNALSIKIMERFEEIQECLHINLQKTNRMWVGPCPIHGGDKGNALNIYHTGESYVGNWKCRTNQCEKSFIGSIIGFIRGTLSHLKYEWSGPGDKTATFQETLDFISRCLNEDYTNIDIDFAALEKSKFIREVALLNRGSRKITNGITRSQFRDSLLIPAKYFINRGFHQDILDKYDVGLCADPKDINHFNRIVVPIYDDKHNYIIADTSRSIYEKCDKCGTWHNPKIFCPREENTYKYAKWKHTYGFKKEEYFYNYWFAKEHIQQNKVAILTESPGNIWRLEEAGIPVGLATFGASFSDGQQHLLSSSGAMTIIIAMDNDDAGQKCAVEVDKACSNTYNIYNFVPTKNDLGDMSVQEIRDTILPLYLSCVKHWK